MACVSSVELLNASAGFLISPFDLPGVAVLISAGRRVAAVWKPAAYGACVGIALRIGHESCISSDSGVKWKVALLPHVEGKRQDGH